jgi:LacI family transcriptional regulator
MVESRTGPRLEEVAREVGVHPTTVSRALDPLRSHLVRSETREVIELAAKRMGYRPDLIARGLQSGRTSSVGVIVADLGNRFGTPMIHQLAAVLDTEMILPVIAETRDEHNRFARILDHMIGRRVDALVVAAARIQDQEIIEEANRSVPVVIVGRALPNSSLPQITTDDREGGSLVAQHLADLGHSRIAQLRGPTDVAAFNFRGEGFSELARARGMTEIDIHDTSSRPIHEEGRRLAKALFRLNELPTAVFAHNDLLALGVLAEFQAAGIRVPHDVSLVGYNDLAGMDLIAPPLTTIRPPTGDIGREAGKATFSLMAGEVPPDVCLPPTLMVRSSTSRPRR